MKAEHIVPLATRVVATLRKLHRVQGHGKYVFPSLGTGDARMSENAVNAAPSLFSIANVFGGSKSGLSRCLQSVKRIHVAIGGLHPQPVGPSPVPTPVVVSSR
jgi:hypothetical protein